MKISDLFRGANSKRSSVMLHWKDIDEVRFPAGGIKVKISP